MTVEPPAGISHADSQNESGEGVSSLARPLAKVALFMVGFTVLVILWGAVVRATGSGAGCGDHWPKCDGEIIPGTFTYAKSIEFTHRVMTGLWLWPLGFMVVRGFQLFKKGDPARRWIGISGIFGVIECLVGAALVRFELVAENTSVARAWVMSLHHLNTTVLLASLVLAAYFLAGGRKIDLKSGGSVLSGLVVGAIGMTLTIVSGAITALGDTLFPVTSTAEGLRRSLDPASHFLERIRIAHPIISISASLMIVMLVGWISTTSRGVQSRKLGQVVVGMILAQLVLGFVNVLLKAPIWMQLVHLLVADAIWIAYVVYSAKVMAVARQNDEAESEEIRYAISDMSWRERVQAFVVLTKPRVISLLLFTTLAAMFIAKQGMPNFGLILAVMIGGYCAAGAANAINMVIDSDIDGRMKRTATRPTVAKVIPPAMALGFAFVLETISFVLLSVAANVLTACLALAGLLFYVFIYTLLLKRRTWQNIVIGGAAGSFPPLVGYAAVTNSLSPYAWFLFALIFFWTPVHFWALALVIKDEYADVGVPMLPVVRGDRATVVQIILYAVLTSILGFVPVLMGQAGAIYLVAAVLLNAGLVFWSVKLMQKTDRPRALWLFKYSMIYLAIYFVMIAIDRSAGAPWPAV